MDKNQSKQKPTSTLERSNHRAVRLMAASLCILMFAVTAVVLGVLQPWKVDAATPPVEVNRVIRTVSELENFRDAVNGGKDFAGQTVVLANDLDLTGVAWNVGIGTGSGSTSVNPFRGTFDGRGFVIKNLTGTIGLFYIIDDATILNTHVENATITSIFHATNSFVGGITGVANGNTRISNVSFSGSLSSNNANRPRFSGIVGHGNGVLTIENATADVNISGSFISGGIISTISAGVYNITNVKVTGSIFADISGDWVAGAGGVVGIVATGETLTCSVHIINAFVSATISATNNSAAHRTDAAGIIGLALRTSGGNVNTVRAYVTNCVVLSPSINATGTALNRATGINATVGTGTSTITFTPSGTNHIDTQTRTATVGGAATGNNTSTARSQFWFEYKPNYEAMGWDLVNIWEMGSDNLPSLQRAYSGILLSGESELFDLDLNGFNISFDPNSIHTFGTSDLPSPPS